MRRGPRGLLAAGCLLASGCLGTVIHLDRNAPGRAALSTPPPADLPVGAVVDPADPGERLIAVVPAVSIGGAYWDGSFSASSSAELAIFYGDRTHSHYSDDLPFGDNRVAPERSIGGAVGVDLLAPGEAHRRITASIRLTDFLGGLEVGWGVEPADNVHSFFLGAYLPGWSRAVYLRLLYGLERQFGFEAGIALDYALTWLWSR